MALTELGWRGADETTLTKVEESHPLPVAVLSTGEPGTEVDVSTLTVKQMIARNINWFDVFCGEGRMFYAADADQDDKVTGQTSFADTTPTFMLRVPTGTTCVPVLVALGQSGTVAGDTVNVIIESDDVDRFSSGTAETRYAARVGSPITPAVLAYSTVTASAGYGTRVMGISVGQDVAPAEGISNEIIWSPTGPDFLVGPASFLVYTFAGTIGPTWYWTLKWLEFPTTRFGF